MKENYKNMFYEEAYEGARKLCGQSRCICSYESCHKRNKRPIIPNYAHNQMCPIQCYGIEEIREPQKLPNRDSHVSVEELKAICALCDHSAVEFLADDIHINKELCFSEYCVDCPVEMALESIGETEAEARCV